jgi:uncharacterized protein YcbK (DUF882 family)
MHTIELTNTRPSIIVDPSSSAPIQPVASRRQFLTFFGLAVAMGITQQHVMAATPRLKDNQRQLRFYNTHTGERVQVVYWEEKEYVKEALAEINYLLRDHYTDTVHSIEPRLLDLLHDISVLLETAKLPLHVLSGYRTPATNAKLRAHGKGAAKHSLHMEGRAIDIRMPGRSLIAVRRVALALKGGGVGYYPRHDFVHLDVGPVRYWEKARSKPKRSRRRRRAA